MPKNTRLTGHELLYEGLAFDSDGRRASLGWSTGGKGHGRCSCGALSPELDSGSKRKAWHRDHKDKLKESKK